MLAGLAMVWPRPFLVAFIFVYPAASFIKVTKANLSLSLPIIVVTNVGLVIVLGGVLRIASIPLRPEWLVVGAVLIVVAHNLARIQRTDGPALLWEPPSAGHWTFALIYGLVALALVARVASTFGIQAPILHDPMAHAFMTQSILDARTIGYFYAPGLHILSAFVADASGSTSALSIHYTTNVASALSVLTWPMAAYVIFRNRVLAIALAVFIFIGPYPERLYLEQGKNAFVLALALLPLVFIAVDRLVKHPTRSNGVLLGGALLVIFFVHHGTFLYAIALTGLTALGAAWVRRTTKELVALIRAVGWAVLVVAGIVGLWLSLGLWDVDITSDPLAGVDYRQRGYLYRVGYAIGEAYDANRHALYRSALDQLPFVSVALLVVSLSRRSAIRTGVLLIAATGFLTPVLVPVLSLPLLNYLSRETGSLLLFPLFAVVYAGGVSVVSRLIQKRALAVATMLLAGVVLAPLVVFHARDTFQEFDRASDDRAFVTSDDMEAFEWIRANLDDDPGFINNAYRGTGIRSHAIFPSDGGMWLPVFTSAEVAMSFVSFSSPQTHERFALYEGLRSEAEAYDALSTLNAMGFVYYYHPTRRVRLTPLDLDLLRRVDGIVVEELFSNGTVFVFRLESG